MNDTYEGFLKKIEELKNDSTLSNSQKKAAIVSLNGAVDFLHSSINYRKLKDKNSSSGIVIDTKLLDELSDNDLLETFFGTDDINEIEKKLKVLKKALREINK